jgi:hypothetical protein
MTRVILIAGRLVDVPSWWHKRLGHGLLALGLAFPGAAHPYTLEHLLGLPLARLLQLEISLGRGLQVADNGAPTTVHLPSAGGRHAH